MPDVRVTVDGREVFARDCTEFSCEQTASGEFTASGTFSPVEFELSGSTLTELAGETYVQVYGPL